MASTVVKIPQLGESVAEGTIGRWLKEPEFINLLHARGIMVAGPLRITADDSATLEEVETNESVAWIATAETPAVLGSLVVSDASFLRLVFVSADDVARVQADIEAKRFPLVPEARRATSWSTRARSFAASRWRSG